MNIKNLFPDAGEIGNIIKPIIFLVLIIVCYFLVTKWIKNFKERKVGRAQYDKGQLNPGTNYDNIVAGVHRAIESGFWVWKDTAEIEKQAGVLNSLSDNELKFIYNRYDELYGEEDETLRSKLDVFCLTCPNLTALLARMDRLLLN